MIIICAYDRQDVAESMTQYSVVGLVRHSLRGNNNLRYNCNTHVFFLHSNVFLLLPDLDNFLSS